MNHQNKIIGRQLQKTGLTELFEKTRNGQGTIALIAGEAGMGKTLLAEEMLSASGLSFYTGRTTEGVTLPYGPVTGVLRDYLRRTNTQSIDCGPLTQYLACLLPELGTGKAQPDAETLVETLIAALSAIADREPAAIFFDDLHWADDATLYMLPLIAERTRNLPLLILGTYRSDEIPRGHQLRRMRNELRRRRLLHEITIENLTRDETEHLINRAIGASPAPSLTDIIYEKTLGVPLFVEELSAVLSSHHRLEETHGGLALPEGEGVPVPESIRDAVLLRLDNLTESSRNLLEISAVAGIEFDFDLVTNVAQTDEGLADLIERNWITEIAPGRGSFRHGLVREAVYNEITWSKRRTLHRRIAEHLESSGAPPEQISEHWLAANEMYNARKALLVSAERSCELHAYRDAARAAHRALENWREGDNEELRLQTLERLAQCAQLNGQLGDAVRSLKEVVDSPIVKKDFKRYAKTQRSLATVYGLQGAWEQYLTARTAAAEAFEKSGADAEAATEWLAAATRNYGMSNIQPAIDLSLKAYDLAVKAGRPDLQTRILGIKGNALSAAGRLEEGIETVHEGLSLALQHNLPEAASDAYKRLGDSLEAASRFSSASKAYHSAYNFCRRQGDDKLAQLCLGCMAYVLFRTGNWKQCDDVCREVLNDSNSFEGSLSLAYGMLGFVNTYRGTFRAARKYINKGMELVRKLNIENLIMGYLEGRALLDELEGKDESAAENYRQLLEMRAKINDDHYALPALCSAVTFFATRGMEKDAVLCSKALADMAKHSGNIENLGVLAYALGETSLLQNNTKEAIRQFEQASEHFEKLETPLERLKAEFRLGVAHKRNHVHKDAIKHLRNAYNIAKNLGCRPLASQIADELDTLGEPVGEQRSPEAASRAAYNGLTRRQVEILRLITNGLTNKEIAAKLYLSPRTVEMHVANILDRLNCRSRIEAVRKAKEMGMVA